jgi:hypothetical protein
MKYQKEILEQLEIEKKKENNWFHFKNEEEIIEYQIEKTGISFPCKTNNVLEINMLFGKKFEAKQKNKKIFSVIETNDTIIESNLQDIKLDKLEERADSKDPILIQVQLRGSGKTNLLYSLAKKRDVIYIDFTCDNNGNLTNFASVRKLFDIIKENIKKIKDLKILRYKTQEILDIFLLSNLIYHGIFREIIPDKKPEYFFRFSINSGQDIIANIFNELLKYKISDIKDIASSFKNNVLFEYDEVGCLTDLFSKKFLPREVDKNSLKNDLRGFFHVFADSVINLRSFRYYQSKN